MKTKKNILSMLAIAGLTLSSVADASLENRGFGLIYDNILDVTWLQDANYAKTSGYDADGRMSWSNANSWAANLSYDGGIYGTIDDWRLTTMQDTGTAGCNHSFSGGIDCGYNVQTRDNGTGEVFSEMAYMFYENLGNLSARDTSGVFRGGSSGTDWGVTNTGLFANLESYVYWSAVEYAPDTVIAWGFSTNDGSQGLNFKSNEFYAWAVRSGDVTASVVPVPAAFWLMASGLLGMVSLRKKR